MGYLWIGILIFLATTALFWKLFFRSNKKSTYEIGRGQIALQEVVHQYREEVKFDDDKLYYTSKFIPKYLFKKKYSLIRESYFPTIKGRLNDVGIECYMVNRPGKERKFIFLCESKNGFTESDIEYISFVFQEIKDDYPEIKLNRSLSNDLNYYIPVNQNL